jgi:hypothetical protein
MLYMVGATLVATFREHQECPKGATLLAAPREHQEYPKGEGGMNGVQNR